MAEAWRKFEEEAQQMRKVEMNAYQYGEKKDMESNVIIQQMRQAEGTIGAEAGDCSDEILHGKREVGRAGISYTCKSDTP